MKLRDLGEHQLLSRIVQPLGRMPSNVSIGPGDDGAVFSVGESPVVVSCDVLVEGQDFSFSWATWADVGWKAVAVNLSDLAAMGAEPVGIVIGLALSRDTRVEEVDEFYEGINACLACHGGVILGGDLSQTSGPMTVSITAIGKILSSGKPLKRYRGKTGDSIWVSGQLGAAALGWRLLEKASMGAPGVRAAQESLPRELIDRQLRPVPRLELGKLLSFAHFVGGAVDISDGIGTDIRHVVSPGCGADVFLSELPMSSLLDEFSAMAGTTKDSLALYGGEDFEILAVLDPQFENQLKLMVEKLGISWTRIGEVCRESEFTIVKGDGSRDVLEAGFEHFWNPTP